jgi:hypothetical protein
MVIVTHDADKSKLSREVEIKIFLKVIGTLHTSIQWPMKEEERR